MKQMICLLLCVLALAAPAGAVDVTEAQAQQFGMDRLDRTLEGEAAELMPDVSPVAPGSFADGIEAILTKAVSRADALLLDSIRTAVSILAVVILCAMVTQMETKLSRNAVLLAGALAITLLNVTNLRAMVGLGRETLAQLQSFTALLLPVLASATIASGGAMAGSAIYVATVFVSTLLMGLINRLLIPLLYAFIAVSAANAVLGNQTLSRLQEFGKWVLTNALKLAVFLFTGYLSLSGVIAGVSDGAALKAAKLAVSSMVPVVGGMISDASETVLVSAQVLKSAAGVFGMLAVLAICLMPLLRLGVQHLVLKLTAALCATVGEKPLIGLIESLSTAMGFLMGMTGACGFMLLISCVCSIQAVTP
ncbi:MAG: stage III sporulation protein AE [Oscillospiraceae bacterium]|nr:stage III sporulation protein AE [Oscillospiraceae bacterium]